MKNIFLLIGVLIVLFSCKTSRDTISKPCMVIKFQLRSVLESKIKYGILGENPLIIKGGEVYKRFNEMDSLELDTTYIESKRYLFVPKNSNYFINLLGNRAEDGFYSLNEKGYIDEGSKTRYLINGIEATTKQLKRNRKKTRLNYCITGLKLKKGELINVIDLILLNKD